MTLQTILTDLIEPEAKALGFDLVRIKMFGGDDATLQVMAERPDTRQLTIDDCAALSRAISTKLDALEEAGKDPIEGAYRLEVSSPGIDRPLTRPQDFADWAGYEAKITLDPPVNGRKTIQGILGQSTEDIVHLDERKQGPMTFAMSHIISAKLVLTDKLIAETARLSPQGADLIEEEG